MTGAKRTGKMKYFKEGRDRQYKAYYELSEDEKKVWDDREITHIKVSLEYTKGGINYYSGATNPRGYRITTTPVALSDQYGYTTESYTLLGDRKNSGGYVMIEPSNRYNAGRLAQLAYRYDAKVPEIAKAVIKDSVAELVTLVKDADLAVV